MAWGGAPNTNSFDGPHAYYWFDGLPFNRPVVVCLHKGSGINVGPSGEAPPWQELNADFPSQLHAIVYSPGFAMVRNTYGPGAEMVMYNSAQPINKHETRMRWTLTVRREIEDAAGDDVMKGIIDGLSDDYPIWANKVHRRRPVFCKGDESLVMFRKWVRQFYLTSEDKREIA